MSCKHAEDVCQDCLEKVQTTTEEAPPSKISPKKENSPPSKISPKKENLPPSKISPKKEKTKTLREKRNNILIYSAILIAFGALAYFNTKLFLISGNIDTLLDTIDNRTRKE